MRGYTKTLLELATRLGSMLDDASHERWTLVEKKQAINLAVLSAWPRWHEVQIIDTESYAKATFEYDIPEGIEDLIAVYLEPVTATEAWKLIRGWHTVGDKLYFHEAQDANDGKLMRLVGVRAPWEIRENTAADGVCTISTGTFSSATATFQTVGTEVYPGDRLILVSGTLLDAADVKVWWIESVDSGTELTVYGDFTASATAITYYINRQSRVPEMYLLHKGAAECFQLAGHKGAGQDIAEDMQWAEFHSQMAEYYLEKQERKFPARRG